jgi:hypothetical protein
MERKRGYRIVILYCKNWYFSGLKMKEVYKFWQMLKNFEIQEIWKCTH